MILRLISGWASTADCWAPILKHLGDFPVVHHCWSEPLKLPDGDCILVGWSLGAIRALEVAMEPQVKGLVLIAGTTRFTADGDHLGTHPRVLQRMQRKLPQNRDKVMSDFSAGCFHPNGEGMERQEWLAATTNFTSKQLGDGLEVLATLDLRDLPPRIDIPALVIHGTEDMIIPPEAGKKLAGALPRGTMTSIEGGGHGLPMTAPLTVANHIKGFVNAHFANK